MMFSTARNTVLTSALLAAGSLLLSVTACTSDDTDPPTGTGGKSGTTGGSANLGGVGGGSGGTGGAATGSPGAKACPSPSTALISDFTYTPPAPGELVTFGAPTTDFSGGTFIFPSLAEVPTPMYPLTSDVTAGNWHIEGPIGNYSGFGLYLPAECQKFDASAFKGIRFTVSGSVAMASSITFAVGTARNDIAAAWLNARDGTVKEGFGRCTPASENRYDGSCASPSKVIPVTPTPTTVTVLWAELLLGRPDTSVNPTELTSIAWSFPPPTGAGTAAVVPYEADITIDDLQFVE